MRPVLVIIIAACGVLGVCGQDLNEARSLPRYDSRYDYLDIDAILDSKRLVKNYVDCLINVKPCTPEGKALKRILPEALRTKCIRCTERQKKTAVKVIKRLKFDYPEEWTKLSARWDPTGDFTRFFEDFLAKEQSNTISPGNEDRNTVPPRPPPQRSTPPGMIMSGSSPTPSPGVTPQSPTDNGSTATPRPILLNRFGEDGDLMPAGGSTLPNMGSRPMSSGSTERPVMQTRPSDVVPTRFPLRPPTDMPPPYSTAITLIDQIGFKIMRTTELVTDILRNTVKAVVGR